MVPGRSEGRASEHQTPSSSRPHPGAPATGVHLAELCSLRHAEPGDLSMTLMSCPLSASENSSRRASSAEQPSPRLFAEAPPVRPGLDCSLAVVPASPTNNSDASGRTCPTRRFGLPRYLTLAWDEDDLAGRRQKRQVNRGRPCQRVGTATIVGIEDPLLTASRRLSKAFETAM